MGSYAVTPQVVGSSRRLWLAAQAIGVVATAVLLVALFMTPKTALALLWNVAIPLLPASFLINPVIWRNVCPLATLSMLPNGLVGRRALGGALLPGAGAIGMVLLAVLVPARRGVFNTDGVALAAVILSVVLVAMGLGAVFDLKAGFCNAICPVLPVERLYGQRPLLSVGNPRCVPCTMCTLRGCIDLAPAKSIPQLLGRSRRSHAWLVTPYGIFAAAFPGFVIGYYLTADGPLGALGSVYLTVAAWAAGSYLVTTVVVRALRLSAGLALPALGVLALGCYYWFAAPVVGSTLGAAGAGTLAIRAAAFTLLAVWLWDGLKRPRASEP